MVVIRLFPLRLRPVHDLKVLDPAEVIFVVCGDAESAYKMQSLLGEEWASVEGNALHLIDLPVRQPFVDSRGWTE